MSDQSTPDDDGSDDPFRPPDIPTDVQCLHCGEEYQSYLIEYRISPDNGSGFWCCPTPGCDGAGFGFDILPSDPEWHDPIRGGWVQDDQDEDDLFDEPTPDPQFPRDDNSPSDSPSDDDIPF